MREVYYSQIHVCIFIIIIILFSERCCCVDQQYEACVPRNCGNKSISFPFFIAGVQPAYCGSPGFNITCVNNTKSILKIPEYNQDLLVDEIFYDNQSLRVSNDALGSKDESCGAIRQIARNLTVRSDHFQYISDSRLVLLWNCSTNARSDGYRVDCDGINYLVMKGNDANLGTVACKMRAEAPIIDDDQIVTSLNYSTVMRRGFVLKWRANDCGECKLSNGRCGFDIEHDQFLCFCRDRPHYRNCTATPTPTSSGSSSGARGIVPTVLLPIISLLAVVLGILWCICKYRKKNKEALVEDETDNGGEDLPSFDFRTIANATNNFSNNNKLGEGGFGPVYKGILEDGKEIAVKKPSTRSTQGVKEFKNEVSCIAKLQHRNLVRLLGWSTTEEGERMLIYEYMPNKSLNFFIFGDIKQRASLDWPKRYNIINGIAKGLLYLHEDSRLRVIHRDLKASNILLDYNMNPKISDFGMARSFGDTETEANTARVVGTYGYMSPEYAIEGAFSVKSDVYSFGVLMIEIVSGHKSRFFTHPGHNLNLMGHAWMSYKEDKLLELIDESILESVNQYEVFRVILIGLLCVQQYPEDRPNMSSVLKMLTSNISLPHPKQPGFFTERKLDEEYNLSGNEADAFYNLLDSSSSNHTVTTVEPR